MKKINRFKPDLAKFLKAHKIKYCDFAPAIGISIMQLYRYRVAPETIPKIVKRAIMQYTNDIIHFSEVE